jgi:hypothetical protein
MRPRKEEGMRGANGKSLGKKIDSEAWLWSRSIESWTDHKLGRGRPPSVLF